MPTRIGLTFLCLLLLSCLARALWLPTLHDDPTVQQVQDRGHGDSGPHGDILDSRDAEYQNRTLEISSGKRSLHPAGSADEWNQLVMQGKVLLEKMWSDDVNSDRSPFEVRADLKSWGWTQHDIVQADSVARHISGLDRLRGVEDVVTIRNTKTVDSQNLQDWKALRTVQDKQYLLSKDGRNHGPSRANYGAIYNTHARVISWVENHPPRKAAPHMSAEDLPALRDFCDVGFLTYCQLDKKINLGPTNAGTVQPIAWFHIPYVKYDQATLSAVTTVLNQLGHQGTFPDSPITVPIGTDAFNALLATPIISQMADINIRHKRWFIPSTIASITIYNSWIQTKGSQAGHDAPGFLVHTTKVDEALERCKSENEQYERQNAARGLYNWPHKMRPMTHAGKAKTWHIWQSPPRPAPGQIGQVAAVAGPSNQGQSLSRRGDQSIERIVEIRGADDANVKDSSTSLTERMNEPYEGQRQRAHLEAGQKLFQAMIGMQQFVPPQAEWYSTTALKTKGWKLSSNGPQDLSAIRFLDGYAGVEGLGPEVATGMTGGQPKSVTVSFADPKDWKEMHHRHKAVGEDDAYHSIVSYKSQVVAQLANNAPYPQALNPNPNPQVPNSQQMPGNLPEPHNWGDLVIPEYIAMSKRKPTGTFGPPAWWPIFTPRHKATSPQAQEAIQAFLDINDLNSVPVWPGVTFPIGSLTYMQLLSSLEIKQIVWSFIQHKQMFGNAVITSITVFDGGPDSDNGLSQLHFVAYVQKFSPLLKEMEAENRSFETRGGRAFEPMPGARAKGPLNSKRGPQWPKPLRPVKNFPNAPSYQSGPAPGPGGSKYQGQGGQHDPVRGSSKNPYNQLLA